MFTIKHQNKYPVKIIIFFLAFLFISLLRRERTGIDYLYLRGKTKDNNKILTF